MSPAQAPSEDPGPSVAGGAAADRPGRPGPGRGGELWLVRHAEVAEAWRGRAYGDHDVPLAPEGLEHTRELGRQLAHCPIDLVQSSSLSRARTLAEAVVDARPTPLEIHPQLREVHRGRWQGRRVTELADEVPGQVQAFYSDPWGWRGHGGESDADLSARAWPCIDAGLERVAGGRLLVASHYNVIRVLVAEALGIPPVHSFALRVDPGRLSVLRDEPDGWHLAHLNLRTPPCEEARP